MSVVWQVVLAILGSDVVVLVLKAVIDAVKAKSGKKSRLDCRLDAIDHKLDGVCDRTTENYLSILRITVIDSDMPMSERLEAGKKYIAAGGNGDVKHKYLELKEAVDGEII